MKTSPKEQPKAESVVAYRPIVGTECFAPARSICGKGGVAFAEFVITRTLPDSEETCSEVSIHQWKTDSAGKVVSFQTFAMQPGERCWY